MKQIWLQPDLANAHRCAAFFIKAYQDHSKVNNLEDLARDVLLNGHYGGIRLIKATLAKFHNYCKKDGVELEDRFHFITLTSER